MLQNATGAPSMKTAAQAAAAYALNGSAAVAVTAWATDYNAKIPAILDAAIAAIPKWQTNVGTALAASNMAKGLTKAKSKVAAIQTKVSGVGSASFAAGVRAAGGPTGNYTAFIAPFLTAVANEVATLNTTNPRGSRLQNRARQAAYDDWIDTQAGNFRVV
jgi:hypothetical protein